MQPKYAGIYLLNSLCLGKKYQIIYKKNGRTHAAFALQMFSIDNHEKIRFFE